MSEFETNSHLPAKADNIPPVPSDEGTDSFGEYIEFEEIKNKKPLISLPEYGSHSAFIGTIGLAFRFLYGSAEEGMAITQKALIYAPYTLMLAVTTPLAAAFGRRNGHTMLPYMAAATALTLVVSKGPENMIRKHFKEQNKNAIQKKPTENLPRKSKDPGIEYYNCT